MTTEAKARDPRRRGRAWRPVSRGVKVPSELSGRPAFLAELRAWQQVLPASAAWTGLTGAEVHRLWMPTPVPDAPRFVALGTVTGEVYPARHEIAASRHPTPPTVVTIDGVTVEPVAECIRAAARFLPLLDLVVLMDSALQLKRCTLLDLQRVAGERRRGAKQLRAALALVDGRSESAWETLLRLLHVLCGIAVEPQVKLYDSYGAFVARADLRVVGTSLLQEYDGVDHLKTPQQHKDLARLRRVADVKLERRGYVATEVLNQPHMILRAADAALGRPTSTDPGPWLAILAESLYRPAGRQAFLERLRANWSHLPR